MYARSRRGRQGPAGFARQCGILTLGLLLALTLGPPAEGRSLGGAGASFFVVAAAHPPRGELPLPVRFTAAPSSGNPTAYSWSFGDGTWLNGSDPGDASPVHTYTTAGTFAVGATIWEGAASSSVNLSVTAYVGPLTVAILASPRTGSAPLTILFSTNVTGGSGTYVGFDWNFGDGGVGIGPEVANTYRNPGEYPVQVTVHDSNGTAATTTIDVIVQGPADPPGGLFTSGPGIGILLGALGAIGVGAVATFRYQRRRTGLATPDSLEVRPSGGGNPPEGAEPSLPSGGGAQIAAYAVPPPDLPETESVEVLGQGLSPEYVAEGRRLSHLIILRLASLGHRNPDDVADTRWTQQGLGEQLGATQSRISNVLRRLEAAGVLEVETRHVVGRPRRVKVYQLTGRGEALARSYRLERFRPPGPHMTPRVSSEDH